MRLLKSLSALSVLLLFALAVAGCHDAPLGPKIGTLEVTPVGIMQCPYWTSGTGTVSRIQEVGCGNF